MSIVTPAHGAVGYLQDEYGAERLEYLHEYEFPLVLDPSVWPGFPTALDIPLKTSAYRLTLDGVDIYYLSNDYLDLLPDKLYPPAASEGRDLSFFKSIVFQMDVVHFLRTVWTRQRLVVHAHEPFYHYLVSAALREDPDRVVVSSVNSNMPINKKVYRPQVEILLERLGVDLDLDAFADPEPDSELERVIRRHLSATRLYEEQGPDYLCLFSLVASCGDAIDFLSEGQRDYYMTFRDTPFEPLFAQLTVARVVKENYGKQFIGGSGITDEWFERDPDAVDRRAVLRSLGLAPDRPTFYHAARYSLHHKGQLELMRAVDRVLSAGLKVNFIVRCVTGSGLEDRRQVGNAYFQEVAERYPENVYLDWSMAGTDVLFQHAASSDFCIFPSKFELESFLIAQGEAMACGAVPIAANQEGMRHYRHVSHPREATGFSVRRSFREDDPRLVDDLEARINEAVTMLETDPATYRELSRRSREVARQFTWSRVAQRHLRVYDSLLAGRARTNLPDQDAIRHGWFDLLDQAAWVARRDDIARQALALGDAEAYARCSTLDAEASRQLFLAAYLRADFWTCERLAARCGVSPLAARIESRCEISRTGSGWRVTYAFPEAEEIELFYAAGAGGTGQSYQSVKLLRRDGRFVRRTQRPLPASGFYFLLDVEVGRTVWDEITPAGGRQLTDAS